MINLKMEVINHYNRLNRSQLKDIESHITDGGTLFVVLDINIKSILKLEKMI